MLIVALNHITQEVPAGEIAKFNRGLLKYIEAQAPYIRQDIDQTGRLSEDDKKNILSLAREFLKRMQAGKSR